MRVKENNNNNKNLSSIALLYAITLICASHVNPFPNSVFFFCFDRYLIPSPTKFIYSSESQVILMEFSHDRQNKETGSIEYEWQSGSI